MIQAKDIEHSVLGLALTNEQACTTMLSKLTVEDFTDGEQHLFSGIKQLFTSEVPVNTASLRNYIDEQGLSEQVGGKISVDQLKQSADGVNPEGMNVACDYLKKYTQRRSFLELCKQYHGLAKDQNEDTEELLAKAGSEFFGLLSDVGEKETDHSDAVSQGIEEIQQPIKHGIKTGLDLDKVTYGFKPKQLVIIAGKTSHGKSSFAQNLMVTAAEQHGHVGFVSMEMSRSEIMERVFSMYCDVPLERISERRMRQKDLDKILENKQRMKDFEHGFTIVDRGGIHIDQLYAIARRLKMQKDTRLLIVDYLQQVISEGNTREQEVANVSKMLKRIAMDLDIVVVGLSQFNREATQSRRPQMKQLRYSGAIAQDANTVILLWNPSADGKENFDDTVTEGKWAGKSTDNIVELTVAKNRGGKTGVVKVGFDGSKQQFYNLIEEPKTAMDYL